MDRRHFCFSLLPLAAAATAEGAEFPRPSMDLKIDMPGKGPVALSSYKGKVLAVEFLLTTCPHCQKASQAIEQVYKQLGPKGFQPIGIAINQGGDAAQFAKQYGLSFPVGNIDHKLCVEYMQHPSFLRLLMPQLAFVDRKFMVRAQYAGDSPFFETDEVENVRKEVTPLL